MANRWYHLAIALVLWSLHLCHPYDLKCPETQHFKLRATAKCPENPKKYVCLNNTLEDQYQEKCAKPDINDKGTKVVFQPNLHKANCSKSRYQPIIFETWMNSDCIFLKSECTEEGQAVYSTGSTVADVNCTCDYTKGYTFVTTPANKCYCVPSVEDCSCYMPGCKVSQEHFCENATTGTQNNSSTPLCEAIDEYHNNVQVNKSSLKEATENITKAETQAGTTAFVVLGLICCTPICMCISYVYLELRITFQPKYDQEVLAITGNTAILEVPFSTKSRIKCQWVHTANDDEYNGRWKSYINNGVCFLEINDVTQADDGDYRCILIPRVGPNIKSPTIHLSTVAFQVEHNNISAITGKHVELKLTFSCKQTILGMEWEKENGERDLTRWVDCREDNTCILKINDVTQEDEGGYRCILRPENGPEIKSPVIHLSTIAFQVEHNNISAITGKHVELKLTFSCKQTILGMEWEKENGERNFTRWEDRREDNTCILKINDVTQEDEGGYRCILRPESGPKIKCSAIHLSTISIQLEYNSVPAITGEPVELKVTFSCNQIILGVEWEKENGERNCKRWEDRREDKTCILKINDVKEEDEGDYTCVLRPENGPKIKCPVIHLSTIEKTVLDKIREGMVAGEPSIYHFDRVMIIGKLRVGKTSLVRRLRGESVGGITRTDSIDVDTCRQESSMDKIKWMKINDTKDDIIKTFANIENMSQKQEQNIDGCAVHTHNLAGDVQGSKIKIDEMMKTLTKLFLKTIAMQKYNKSNCENGDEDMKLLCVWDFAGEKDFYATHQAFLTRYAVYILVTDILDLSKNENLWTKLENSTEYLQFWLDIIHCYSNETEDKNQKEDNPPVLVVCTKTDEWGDEQTKGEKKEKFIKQLNEMLSGHRSKKHIRETVRFISNTTDEDDVFESLRQDISKLAINLNQKKRNVPLKWHFFLYILKNISSKHAKVISIYELKEIARHKDIAMGWNDLKECLTFLHDTGHVLFYDKKNMGENVILDPKWLADAFACIISDNIDDNIKHVDDDWSYKLRKTGELTKDLLSKLLEKKSYLKKYEQFIIDVMKQFDIIVTFSPENKMFMPCMMETVEFEQIKEKIPSAYKTPWMCLEFEFLPPAFFNHMLVLLTRQYEVFKFFNDTTQCDQFALYRHIGIFELDDCKKNHLVICEARNIIAVQIFTLGASKNDYTDIRQRLQLYQNKISTRYRLKVKNEISYKCSNGDFRKDRVQNKALSEDTYGCIEHNTTHKSEDILKCWCSDDDSESFSEWQLLTLEEIITKVAKSAVQRVFDEIFGESLWEELKRNEQKIHDLHRRGIIDSIGASKLLSNGRGVTTEDFDIKLMNAVLRNLKDLEILSPKEKPRHDNIVEEFDWICKEKRFKTEREKNLTAVNFYRILYPKHRFQPYNHELFQQYFNSLSKILSDLGGEGFQTECEEVKNRWLSQHREKLLEQ